MLILDQAKVLHRDSRLEAEEVAGKNSHHSEMTVYEKKMAGGLHGQERPVP